MRFAYVCRDGTNEELRYSIRSVVKHCPEANISLFGGKPSWYSGEYIHVPDHGNKFDNINKCYEAICNNIKEDDFILMNDDFFILKETKDFPYYYDGLLEDKIQNHTKLYGLSRYSRVLSGAKKYLISVGIDKPLNYDIHIPMLFNIEKLKTVVNLSFAPRSIYGNMFVNNATMIQDVKVYDFNNIVSKDSGFISTEDNSFQIVYDSILKDMFPEKTKYEL